MISKELLSEVLGNTPNQWNWRYFEGYKNLECTEGTCSGRGENTTGYMSIYEFAHKCKEWALSKSNLELISAITEEGAYCKIDNIIPSTIEYDINQMDTAYRTIFNSIIFDAKTEPEAIFLACEWILKEMR